MTEDQRRRNAFIEMALEHVKKAAEMMEMVCTDICECGECGEDENDEHQCPYHDTCIAYRIDPLDFQCIASVLRRGIVEDKKEKNHANKLRGQD